MDNLTQIEAIKKYWRHLCRLQGKEIDLEMAAGLWIEKYARYWRKKSPFESLDHKRQNRA